MGLVYLLDAIERGFLRNAPIHTGFSCAPQACSASYYLDSWNYCHYDFDMRYSLHCRFIYSYYICLF